MYSRNNLASEAVNLLTGTSKTKPKYNQIQLTTQQIYTNGKKHTQELNEIELNLV